jgi:two-component system response regulator AdeR
MGVLQKPFAIGELVEALTRIKPRGVILIADDDPDFAQSVEPLLSRSGYRVKLAASGNDLLEPGATDGVNCLLLDLRMPVLSGGEAYLRLREAGRAVPTILMTGFALEENETVAQLQPMAQGLLVKPFEPGDLLDAVEQAMRRSG